MQYGAIRKNPRSSYYPFWSTWANANTPDMLKKVQKLAASYGKLFAVLETSWVNSLKDADGTANSIGEDADTSAYSVGPQGQVDELTDLYKTVMSQDNGLGAFYWEPAWIPVKAGWRNWEYNKKIADEYGTGWASKGAVGYFTNDKLYYNGEPAWGGSSWDNETQYAKVEKGKTRTINLPKVSGYEPKNKSYELKVSASKDGIVYKSVAYKKLPDKKLPQGPAIKYNYRVKVKTKKYKVYKNFKWQKSKTKVYKKTYTAKYRYNHENGHKYLALYTKAGKFVGYINAKAEKVVKK